MEITVFSKNMKTHDGRTFRIYLSKLHNKNTGELDPVRVQFREGVIVPSVCPIIIVVDKEDCNLSIRKYKDESGTEKIQRTLWVSKYTTSDKKYEDHSLDDYI